MAMFSKTTRPEFLQFIRSMIDRLTHFHFSIRSRLVFIFVFIFGTTTITFSVFLYYFLNQSLLKDFDDALYNYSIDVSQSLLLGSQNPAQNSPLSVDEGKILPFPSGTALVLIRDLEGKILVQKGNFGDFLPEFKKSLHQIANGADSSYQTIEIDNQIPNAEAESYRVITFPIEIDSQLSFVMQIAAPMGTFETQLEQMKFILQWGLPAVLLIAILSGLFVTTRALRPVSEIAQKAKSIDATMLNQRLPLPSNKDEIYRLSQTLNLMLDRIENAFLSQERFVADASHQLLTPLTIIKGEFEYALKTKTVSEQVLTSGLQEIDNLTQIIKDMLLLARIDAGTAAIQFEPVFIDEVLLDIWPQLSKQAQNKNIQLHLNFKNEINRKPTSAASDLISNLLYNLIENAIKYSPQQQNVMVNIDWNQTSTTFSVEDFGPGIADEFKPHIFKRFSRANTSSRAQSGYGLGLAICQKIAQIHQTNVILDTKNTPGCLFKVQFASLAAD